MKFKFRDVVKHIGSGRKYLIYSTPNEASRLEYCDEPYYEYIDVITKIKWSRRQSEMEDGRFELVEE